MLLVTVAMGSVLGALLSKLFIDMKKPIKPA